MSVSGGRPKQRAYSRLNLFLGSDALAMAETKLAAVTREVAANAAVSRATDF